jgi:hypothetical protein
MESITLTTRVSKSMSAMAMLRQRSGAWACRNESLVSPRKDADPTIPILKQAKAEYAKLQ